MTLDVTTRKLRFGEYNFQKPSRARGRNRQCNRDLLPMSKKTQQIEVELKLGIQL